MSDTIGDERPPSRRGTAVLVVLALVLGGLAVNRLLDAHASPPAPRGDPSPTATATPPRPRSQVALPTPYTSAYPASAAPTPRAPLPPAPWSRLPTVGGSAIDYGVGDRVRWQGHTFRLHDGDQVVAVDRAARGPVVVVQTAGSTVLEQLRSGGSTLVLDSFHDEARHLQGLAVDPSGRRVAYALTSSSPRGPFGLVIRDLAAGAVVASRGTALSFAVRDWTRSGVLLEAVTDEARPPFVWRPGHAEPFMVTPPSRSGPVGPSLLAASRAGAAWAVRTASCTAVVRLGEDADRGGCLPLLARPAAWSLSGNLLAGRADGPALTVVDTATGRATPVTSLRRLFLGQVVWRDDDSLLLAVHTLADRRGAVLACTLADGCSRVRLGPAAQGADLVLAE